MFGPAFRKLTGTLAATATALALMTAAAVPAQAQNYDAARIIGGVAAVALGAKIIHDNKKDRERDREQRERNSRWDDNRDHDRGRHRGHDHDRGRNQQARLPERCITDYDRRRGEVVAIYSEQCLRQSARR